MSTTHVELEEPFSSIWRKGYLQTHPSGRKYIVLYNANNDRTIISYARYLMCVHLGFLLSEEFDVDHENDDYTDDRIDNLQVLSKEDNQLKRQLKFLETEVERTVATCTNCLTDFLIPLWKHKRLMKKPMYRTFCSRRCNASFFLTELRSTKDKMTIERIKVLRSTGLSSYKIADELEISRNTVMKYW